MAYSAIKICSDLMQMLTETREIRGTVHSVFEHAVNFRTEAGMITVLAADKSLQPYSLKLEGCPVLPENPSRNVLLTKEGIYLDGRLWVNIRNAASISMKLRDGRLPREQSLNVLGNFLRDKESRGIVSLVRGTPSNIYTDYLQGRINRFRRICREGVLEEAEEAAYEIAGCGPGLTPSSDDFLSGYLLSLRERKGEVWGERIADLAAGRTNDISASLLRRAGRGYFSEDICSLVQNLKRNCGGRETEERLEKVAAFGSSSGCDFLTGLYFGIMDFM